MIAMNVFVSRQLSGDGLHVKRLAEIYLEALDDPQKSQKPSFKVSKAHWSHLLEIWKQHSFPNPERPLSDAMGRRRYVLYEDNDTWYFEILASLEEARTQVFGVLMTKEQVVDRLQNGLRIFSDLRVIPEKQLAKEVKDFFAVFLVWLTYV